MSETPELRGFGVHIGVNDRRGRPIKIGDVLSFDPREWGGLMTFQIQLKDGEISHPGTTRDLSEWCTIIPHCCEPGCGKPAEFQIAGGSGHFEDVTEACRDHVGALLGTPQWISEDNALWTVSVLSPEEEPTP